MANIRVDFSKHLGKIKPLHGVNSGPRTQVFTYDASPLFREANIPLCRTHDVEYPYGSGEFIDIHCIFKNFDADENDPASYSFALSDKYLEAVLDVGAEIFFRLGESIEHAPVKLYSHPPRNFEKWARICEHIVRHYNEGWADGFHWNIRYWEIWNEPDLDYKKTDNKKMWSGTPEEFFALYEITAKHLRACFPHILIGGPGLASNIEWAGMFIRSIKENGAPFDFFSWHRYGADTESYAKRTEIFGALLRENGFTDTEMMLTEWNYVEDWNRQPDSFRKLVGMRGAAFCAAMLATLQHLPIAAAHYFEADVVKEWCGIFEVKDMAIGSFAPGKAPCVLAPRKPFYAFSSFGQLYRLSTEVCSKSDTDGLYVLGASNGNECAAMIASFNSSLSDEPVNITLSGLKAGTKAEVYLTDVMHSNTLEFTHIINETEMVFELTFSNDQLRFIKIS